MDDNDTNFTLLPGACMPLQCRKDSIVTTIFTQKKLWKEGAVLSTWSVLYPCSVPICYIYHKKDFLFLR